MHMAPGFCTCS